jgi:hypothetical protein
VFNKIYTGLNSLRQIPLARRPGQDGRGVTMRQKRIAIYCNTWQLHRNTYCNILPWNNITEKRPNKHRNSSASWTLPSKFQLANNASQNACRGHWNGIMFIIFLWKREAIQDTRILINLCFVEWQEKHINTMYQKIPVSVIGGYVTYI